MSDPSSRRATRRACASLLALAVTLGTLLPVSADGPEPAPASAGESEAPAKDEPVLEEQVEVEATPIVEGTRLGEHANPVTSVSREQIEALGARDLASAVRRVPGVVISRTNLVGSYGGGQGGALFIRGQGAGRPGSEITMLVDGIPRFVGIWTHPLLDTLSLDGLTGLEIHKSAQPVRLGPLAGFASVDMVPTRRREPGKELRVRGGGGEHATREGLVQAEGRSGAIDWAASASTRRSEGHREGAGGRVSALYGHVGWRAGGGWDLSAQVHHTDAWADDPGPAGTPSVERGFVPRFNTRDTFTLLKARRDTERWSVTAKAYHENGAIDWDELPDEVSVTRWDNLGLHLEAETAPWAGGSLFFGAAVDEYGGETRIRRPSGDGTPVDVDFRNAAAYASVSHRFDAGEITVTPSLGARYNDSRDFGSDLGLQAGVAIDVGRTRFYANWTEAFNLPGVYAAVLTTREWGRGDAWRDLAPESYEHGEIGVLWRPTRALEVQATVFRDDVDDALRFDAPPPRFVNVASYDTEGAEVSLRYSASDRVSLFVAGTSTSTDPEETPYTPEVTWTAGLRARLAPWLGLDLDAQHVGELLADNPRFPPAASVLTPVASYTVASGRLTVEPTAEGDLRLFLQVENIFDEEYQHRPGYPMPGRTLFAGVDLRL
jgi:iron complex outermembrane receptor protein